MRADANQKQIVEALRTCGASVKVTSQVPNFVDLIVGYRGKNLLVEVKTIDGRLSYSQKEFIQSWAGKVIVIRSVEEVLHLINNWEQI